MMLEGLQHLPQPIIQHILNKSRERVVYPHVYHVTELIGCLRKAYFKRKYGDLIKHSLNTLWNFYRGHLFDDAFSPLFPENQKPVTRTYNLRNAECTVVGYFDFIYKNILHDLKTAHDRTMYYLKRDGPRKDNVRQVQIYMELLNEERIQLGRLIYVGLSPNPLQFDVERNYDILNEILANVNLLEDALQIDNPSNLPIPGGWQCKPEYCEARTECKRRR